MSNQSPAVPSPIQSIGKLLEGDTFQLALKKSLPKHLSAERFVRVALLAINRTPKLAECTRESLFECLYRLSAMGLEPNGRDAHLIPFAGKCTLVVDYKGLVQLARRSGEVASMHAAVVYSGDEFDYSFGTGQRLVHRPALKNRGEPVCAYSFWKMVNGGEDFDVMDIDAVTLIRDRSQGYQSAKKYNKPSPWDTDFDAMAAKTVIRRHSKTLPLSPDLREAIEADDEPMTEQERFVAAKPVFGAELFAAPAVTEELSAGSRAEGLSDPENTAASPIDPSAVADGEQAGGNDEPLPALRSLMDADQMTEAEVTAWAIEKKLLAKGMELPQMTDARLRQVVVAWNSTARQEILNKRGGAK